MADACGHALVNSVPRAGVLEAEPAGPLKTSGSSITLDNGGRLGRIGLACRSVDARAEDDVARTESAQDVGAGRHRCIANRRIHRRDDCIQRL